MEHLRTRSEINRDNAQKSTGPRTEEGKARAAANSFKHGLYSQAILINGENVEDYDDLRNDFWSHYSPIDPVECSLVEDLVQSRWRILRFRRHEATVFSNSDAEYPDLKTLTTVHRLLTGAERAFNKALTQLEAIRKQKPAPKAPETEPQPQPDDRIGFVPQNPDPNVIESGFVPQNDTATAESEPESTLAAEETDTNADSPDWLRSEILLLRLP